jgi:GNAT superfamily N-acetyltransferase
MDPAIRPLTAADLGDASTLSASAGWNQRINDWRTLLQIAPRGSFCATDGDRIVGTAIGIDYGMFGWIAMMLVDPAYRGRGLGAALLESAMAALPSHHPVRLDATPLGRQLYQRFGFEDESTLTRRVAQPADRHVTPPHHNIDVRPLTAADLADLKDFDRHVFGGDRAVVVDWVRRERPQYARITREGGPQYCFGRPGRLFDQIGPIVARDDDTARALVDAAVRSATGRALVIDAFDARKTFSAWLQDAGFDAQRPLFRMCHPGRSAFEPRTSGLAEYAILGPEFG